MIAHCAKTRVGNDMMRGISGGELRRLSIAQDLVNNPSLLFLDGVSFRLSPLSYLFIRLLPRPFFVFSIFLTCRTHERPGLLC